MNGDVSGILLTNAGKPGCTNGGSLRFPEYEISVSHSETEAGTHIKDRARAGAPARAVDTSLKPVPVGSPGTWTRSARVQEVAYLPTGVETSHPAVTRARGRARGVHCFRCGQADHLSADCPRHTRGRPDTRGPGRSPAPDGERSRSSGVPPRRPDSEIAADPHGHANRARQLLGIAPTCPDPECVYDSAFRRRQGQHPVHLCQLRAAAAEQVRQFRAMEASS